MVWQLGADVVVGDDGSVTAGSGIKLSLFNSRAAREIVHQHVDPGTPPSDWDQGPALWAVAAAQINADADKGWVNARKSIANQCNAAVEGMGLPRMVAACGTGDAVGNLVRIVSGVGDSIVVASAVGVTPLTPAVGVITVKASETACVVTLFGGVPAVGLTPGGPVYVGADSRPTSTPPTPPAGVQVVGFAFSDAEFFFNSNYVVT